MTDYTSNTVGIFIRDNSRIAPGVTIGGYSGGSGILIDGPVTVVRLDGLAWASDHALESWASNLSLTVGFTGGVSADNVGIYLQGTTTLQNFGSIFSAGYGVETRPLFFGESVTITNSGTIVGGAIGVNTASTRLTLVNTGIGTIMGATAVLAGEENDSVVNMGFIDGEIDLGGRDDTYDGSLGRVVGTIGMGWGNDIATGGFFADTIDGGIGDDILDGGAGNDKLIGGAGNDTFYVDSRLDQVVEAASGGNDTVYASVSYVLKADQEIEHLIADPTADDLALNFTGNAFANELIGNGQVNKLDGRGGADTMAGLGGNDSYNVDDVGDTVIELVGGGSDIIFTTVGYALAAGQEIEVLRADPATGTTALILTGNGFANTLIGNAGDNALDGGAGADWMQGGLGDDTYIVDNVGDVVTDSSISGIDTVRSSVTFTLAGRIEKLTLTGSDNTDGTGNALANQLLGNDGNNILAGKAGNDILTGDAGNDLFLFNTTRNATTNLDTVTDFTSGADHIGLDAHYFKLISAIAGRLSDANFAAGSPTTKDQHILYSSDTGVLSYDQDGIGTRCGAVAFAQVTPGTILAASDFLVI